jgi:hypothetical protein
MNWYKVTALGSEKQVFPRLFEEDAKKKNPFNQKKSKGISANCKLKNTKP